MANAIISGQPAFTATIPAPATNIAVGDTTTLTATATGGIPPYSAKIVGSLPAGRSLSGLAISGTYTAAGVYAYSLAVSDAAGNSVVLPVSVSVAPLLNTLTLSTVAATVKAGFVAVISGRTAGTSLTATASDGTTLSLYSDSINGTFSTAGSKTVTLTETPAVGAAKVTNITVTVAATATGTPTPTPAPTLLTLNDRLVFEGDSEFATSANVQTYPTLIVPKINGRFRMPIGWNQATGGQNTSQIVTQISAVNATTPDLVVLLAGTNDDKSSDAARDTTISNLQTMVAGYTSRYVVIATILPRFAGNALSASEETRRVAINDAIRAMASSRVKVVNLDALSFTSADFIDGLHPNQFGCHKVADVFASVINSISDGSSPLSLYSNAANIIQARSKDPTFSAGGGAIDNLGTGSINGVTTAQAGNATDTNIPAGWVLTNPTSLALTVTRVDRLDGTFGVRIQGNGTAAAAGRIQLRATITRSPAATAGQINEQWIGFDQAANMVGVGALDILSTSSIDYTPGRSQDTGAAMTTGQPALTGVMRTAQIGAYAATGLTSLTFYAEIFVTNATATNFASAFDVTFYKPYSALITAS